MKNNINNFTTRIILILLPRYHYIIRITFIYFTLQTGHIDPRAKVCPSILWIQVLCYFKFTSKGIDDKIVQLKLYHLNNKLIRLTI